MELRSGLLGPKKNLSQNIQHHERCIFYSALVHLYYIDSCLCNTSAPKALYQCDKQLYVHRDPHDAVTKVNSYIKEQANLFPTLLGHRVQ